MDQNLPPVAANFIIEILESFATMKLTKTLRSLVVISCKRSFHCGSVTSFFIVESKNDRKLTNYRSVTCSIDRNFNILRWIVIFVYN